MTESLPKSLVVLGAASGVARAIAEEYAIRGWALVLAGRNIDEIKRIADDLHTRHGATCHPLVFDALAFDDHKDFPAACEAALGAQPEGVILCFGFMAEQSDAQSDMDIARRTMDTNLTGAMTILEAFAAVFEVRRSGFIAALSSVAGDRGRKANYIYGASKGGLTVYLQGLRNRLHPAGVQVTTIKPGFIDTPMTYGMKLPGPLVASPERAAKAMVCAISKGKNVVYVSSIWRYIMCIIKSIPEWQFKKMDI